MFSSHWCGRLELAAAAAVAVELVDRDPAVNRDPADDNDSAVVVLASVLEPVPIPVEVEVGDVVVVVTVRATTVDDLDLRTKDETWARDFVRRSLL
jgi:hypothetical protein